MQTFLPYPDFEHSARVLDWRRLGKQRLECAQLLTAIRQSPQAGGGWRNHPATKMWMGYDQALENYGAVCVMEWKRRGYNNSMEFIYQSGAKMPPWFGDDKFHSAHRAALLHKLPEHYSQFGWIEQPALNYWWPV